MHRNLSTLDLERNLLTPPLNQDIDLGTGRAFHPAHHAVLRELDAGDISIIDLQQTVPGLEPDLLRRASRDDFQHDSRVIRDVELDADAVEISGEILLRTLQVHRRKIYRMRIQSSQRCVHRSISDFVHIHSVHIIPLHQFQNQIQFLPTTIVAVKFTRRGC